MYTFKHNNCIDVYNATLYLHITTKKTIFEHILVFEKNNLL